MLGIISKYWMLKDKRVINYVLVGIEILWSRIITFFGYKYSNELIPDGAYCYIHDIARNKTEPITNGVWIVKCKYYRSTKQQSACIYISYIGNDVCLDDQCKICGEKDENNH